MWGWNMFYFLMFCIGFKMYLFTCYEQVDGFVNRRVFKTLSIAADWIFFRNNSFNY